MAFAQTKVDKKAAAVVEEGRKLYQSEMASWYGSDLFMERYKAKENIGGYFSYTENDRNKCIFYSKDATPKVIGTISFDNTFSTSKAITDLEERALTANEMEYYHLRTETLKVVSSDTLYKQYNNTNYNIIPVVTEKERKVFILTAPTKSGVMLFGNDYLLTFDKSYKLLEQKQLHRSLIPINYGGKEILESSIHSHVLDELITSTDICTLLLYGRFSKMKSHLVMSKKYVSIWDCEKETLNVMTREAFEKIQK